MEHSNNGTKLYFLICGAVLFVLCLFSLRFGTVYIPHKEFFNALLGKGSEVYRIMIFTLRFPEMAACLVAGAGLGMSGVLLQAVTDNKMAGPSLIGVSQGAGFGVIVMLYFFPTLFMFTEVFAFAGAFGAELLIVAVARKNGFSKSAVVLVGLAFGALLSAGISFISLLDSDVLVSYNSFSVGSLANISLNKLAIPSVLILTSFVLSLVIGRKCDILMLGDDVSGCLGEKPSHIRAALMILAGISSASVVSFAGLLGFVGLMAPHISRVFVKENTRTLLFASALTGSSLVMLSHIVSKMAFAPSNVPVGIILSVIGSCFFLGLLLGKGGNKNA